MKIKKKEDLIINGIGSQLKLNSQSKNRRSKKVKQLYSKEYKINIMEME